MGELGARLLSEGRSAMEADGGGRAEEEGTIPNVDQRLARENSAAMVRESAPRGQRGRGGAATTSTIERGTVLRMCSRNIVILSSRLTVCRRRRNGDALMRSRRTRPAEEVQHPSRWVCPVESTTRGSVAWPRRDAALRRLEAGRLGYQDQEKNPWVRHAVN